MALLLNKAARVVTAPRMLLLEQRRHRGKFNVKMPQKLFYQRALMTEFVTPFYPYEKPPLPIWEACEKVQTAEKSLEPPHPYQRIIAREFLKRFDDARMIGFLHKNSMSQEEEFDLAVALKKVNMIVKTTGRATARIALEGTKYEAVLSLFCSPGLIVFSPEPNTEDLRKIVRKTPQVTLLAGILHDQLLSANDFLKYGKMDITGVRSQLVHTLQTAGGINLHRQLNHHQTTLVSRLGQIGNVDGGATESSAGDSPEANSEEAKPE